MAIEFLDASNEYLTAVSVPAALRCADTGAEASVTFWFKTSQIGSQVFWKTHDPTTLNRQGPDVGSQYRSAIFVHSADQEATARAVKDRLEWERAYKRPIVTEIVAAGPFYRAEDYHQRYLERRGVGACDL